MNRTLLKQSDRRILGAAASAALLLVSAPATASTPEQESWLRQCEPDLEKNIRETLGGDSPYNRDQWRANALRDTNGPITDQSREFVRNPGDDNPYLLYLVCIVRAQIASASEAAPAPVQIAPAPNQVQPAPYSRDDARRAAQDALASSPYGNKDRAKSDLKKQCASKIGAFGRFGESSKSVANMNLGYVLEDSQKELDDQVADAEHRLQSEHDPYAQADGKFKLCLAQRRLWQLQSASVTGSGTPASTAPHQSDDQKLLAEKLRQDKEKHDQYRQQQLAHIKAEADRKDAVTWSFPTHEFNGVVRPFAHLHNNTDAYLDFSYQYSILIDGQMRTGSWSGQLVPNGDDDYDGLYSIAVDEGKSWSSPALPSIKWWADGLNFEGTWNQ